MPKSEKPRNEYKLRMDYAWAEILVFFLIHFCVLRDCNASSNGVDEEATVVSEESKYSAEDEAHQLKLFHTLFKNRRAEQLNAVKGLLTLSDEKKYQMVTLIAKKIFEVIQHSRVHLESSGYIPGGEFPGEKNARDALSNVLENTAFFGDVLLRIPEITHRVLHSQNEWNVILKWSIGFCNETKLLDKQTTALINLMSQELNITERDPLYVNPYRVVTKKGDSKKEEKIDIIKKKNKKQIKKGPRLSRTSGDL